MTSTSAPPLILGIETATRALGLAITRGETLIASTERFDTHYGASDRLTLMLQEVLRSARLTLRELDGFAVSVGPGSFTGLRVGVALVKALSMATRLPVVGVSTLEAIAVNAIGHSAAICPIVDAKQEQLYAAWFASRGARLLRRRRDHLTTWERLAGQARMPTLFLGDGVAVYGRQLRRKLGARAMFAPEPLWYPKTATVARLGAARFAHGQHDDARTLVPNYLYPRTCTIQIRPSTRPVRGSL